MRITERLSVNERRKRIMEILSARRSVTVRELQEELGVSERTLRYDISELTTEYPIECKTGRGGCLYVPDGWYLYRHYPNAKQETLLTRLGMNLEGEDAETLQSILLEFGKHSLQKNEKS